MIDPRDNDLKRLFQETRAADAQRAPSFDRVVRNALRVRAPEPSLFTAPWLQLALTAIVLAAFGISLAVIREHRREKTTARVVTQVQTWEAFSNWSAPSDSLLTMSGTAVWSAKLTTPTDDLIGSTNEPDATSSEERGTL